MINQTEKNRRGFIRKGLLITTVALMAFPNCISENNGISWDQEIVVRDNPFSYDMGYPQLLQNDKGELVALYYISTEETPQSYIEAAIISGL
jgi:hypothetical protein